MPYAPKALLLAIAFTALSGCGQTGPLYMPPEEAPQVQPAAPADSAEPQTKES